MKGKGRAGQRMERRGSEGRERDGRSPGSSVLSGCRGARIVSACVMFYCIVVNLHMYFDGTGTFRNVVTCNVRVSRHSHCESADCVTLTLTLLVTTLRRPIVRVHV